LSLQKTTTFDLLFPAGSAQNPCSASLNVHLVDSEATAEAETAAAHKGKDFAHSASRVKVSTDAQLIAYLEMLSAAGNSFLFSPPRTAYDHPQRQRLASQVIPHFR
jgi:hypothetical protein